MSVDNYAEASGAEVARVMAKIMAAVVDEDENTSNLAMTALTIINQEPHLPLAKIFEAVKVVTEFTATVAGTTTGSVN